MLRIALNNVGVMHWKKKGNIKQGLHAFTEGLKLAPDNYALNANIGEVYSKLGKFNLAIKHYKVAQAKKPIEMAIAMKHAVIAGRKSFLSGRIKKSLTGFASTTKKGII